MNTTAQSASMRGQKPKNGTTGLGDTSFRADSKESARDDALTGTDAAETGSGRAVPHQPIAGISSNH
jgi:hypothetical protein